MTTCAQAIKNFETAQTTLNGGTPVVAADEAHVKLYCQQPPVAKMDSALNSLVNCERLALSTNSIDRIIPLTGLTKLKILSLGRNAIKKVSHLNERSNTVVHSYYSSLPRRLGSGRLDVRDYGMQDEDKAALVTRNG